MIAHYTNDPASRLTGSINPGLAVGAICSSVRRAQKGTRTFCAVVI